MHWQNALAIALTGCWVASCSRPVTGVSSGSTSIFDLRIEPAAIKENVDVRISFRVSGDPPERTSYDIAGQKFDCTAERGGDGRYSCTHSGVTRENFQQGFALVVVEAVDSKGRSSVASERIVFDFDCPFFATLTVTPAIAQPGDTATLIIEASEALASPPRVSRGGIAWPTPVGAGQSYSLSYNVTAADPASATDVVVELVDLANNRSTDCAIEGRAPFGVDHGPPSINPREVTIERGAPGTPSFLIATAGAITDDVRVAAVQLHDEDGTLIAEVEPNEDGSVSRTNLGAQSRTRVLVRAIDQIGRESSEVTVRETWRLTVGAGATPNAGLRTAVRVTPPQPDSLSMRNRTVTLASSVLEADALNAIVRAPIGFHKVGELPQRYEDRWHMAGGYEPASRTIVGIGGIAGRGFVNTNGNGDWYPSQFADDTALLTWDELEGEYAFRNGPPLVVEDPNVPSPRFNQNIAFDGKGCGLVHGGRAIDIDYIDRFSNGSFRICSQPNGAFEWDRIDLQTAPGDPINARNAPVLWDPRNERYMVIGEVGSDEPDRVRLIIPNETTTWESINLAPLPSNFADRFEHFVFFDPILQAVTIGGGSVFPNNSGEEDLMWTYVGGQWIAYQNNPMMVDRRRYRFAYDVARRQLVSWGGNYSSFNELPPDETVYLMTKTATNGPNAWTDLVIDHPVPRNYPVMVYDSDREVVVTFAGVRDTYNRNNDPRWIEPDVYEIVVPPSIPYLMASVDLAAQKPIGVESLTLTIGAQGVGDADGVGPGAAAANGVKIQLWDSALGAWVDAQTTTQGGLHVVEISDRPERFVRDNGTVPVLISSRYVSTAEVESSLEVDVIDGQLNLRAGVQLP